MENASATLLREVSVEAEELIAPERVEEKVALSVEVAEFEIETPCVDAVEAVFETRELTVDEVTSAEELAIELDLTMLDVIEVGTRTLE